MRRGDVARLLLVILGSASAVEIRPRRKLSGRIVLGNSILGVSLSAFATLGWSVASSEDATWGEARGDWILGAAALTGLFTLTDLVFKKGYELSPKELTVTLTKAQGPPRVRTMFVDAGDLENITRIRIQRD